MMNSLACFHFIENIPVMLSFLLGTVSVSKKYQIMSPPHFYMTLISFSGTFISFSTQNITANFVT